MSSGGKSGGRGLSMSLAGCEDDDSGRTRGKASDGLGCVEEGWDGIILIS